MCSNIFIHEVLKCYKGIWVIRLMNIKPREILFVEKCSIIEAYSIKQQNFVLEISSTLNRLFNSIDVNEFDSYPPS